jgi:hypothetical protein
MRDTLTGFLAAWFVEGWSPISFVFAAHYRSWYERRGGMRWLCHDRE